MQKFAEKSVKLRIPILIISILLLIPSFIGFVNTRINYDILYYLPDDIETMQGQDILMDEFGKGAYGMIVCNGMSSAEVIKTTDKIKNIDHVAGIICYDSITGGKIPKELLPQEVQKIFYSEDGQGTLMFIFFDTTTSADETMDAIEKGAEEVDMVIHVGAAKAGNWDYVKKDISQVVCAAKKKALVKVIIETCLLSDEEKRKVCMLAQEAGADFVKTSTGFSTGGATIEDIKLMRETVGPDMGVKASGGIRDYETAVAMIQAGATRIGTSSAAKIMEG